MSEGASKLLGVLGHPIGHSQSPGLFKRILSAEGRDDVAYRTFDLPEIKDFQSLTLDHPNLVGLNVTVPHKQAILSKLVRVSKKPKPSVP